VDQSDPLARSKPKRSREVAAKALGVSTHTIIALEEVSKPDVPEAIREVADRGEVPITRLAEAIKDTRAEKAKAIKEALAAEPVLDFGSSDEESDKPKEEPVVKLDAKVIIEKATARQVGVTASLQAGSEVSLRPSLSEPEVTSSEVVPAETSSLDLYTVLEGISKMLSARNADIRALPQKDRVKAVLIAIMKKAKAAIPVVPVASTTPEDDYLDSLLD
jgi:hypothetical protein